ncbi:MAG: methyltransferase [Rhodospirillaceae bacterium]|nr:methyltransferase [Rhodospirillaceae bacterium]|tara:strand:+ start:3842 stop:4675 length:834 start_codon:yes stop_codon:yes gene_type:complete
MAQLQQEQPLEQIQATVSFVVDTGQKPVNIPSTPGGGESQHIGEYEDKTVIVRDARPLAAELSVDREGFALVPLETQVTDFYDNDQIENIYNPELVALLKKELGAKDVFVFDHTVRAGDEKVRSAKKVREPVLRAHNDYTVKSGPVRVKDWFGEEKAAPLLERRFSIVNVWRSIVGAIERNPLAICDARSVPLDDMVATERRAAERVGETYRLTYNASHQWYYFPLMQRNEAMLIKSYESESDGRARFTPHTAIEVPNTPENAAPRQSIESRLFAFF